METFIWTPEFGANKTVKPNVTQVKFADGYEQRFSHGLNSIAQTWSLSFAHREPSEANAIDAFLTARAGVEAFLWTPPDSETALVFVCRAWEKAPQKGGRYTISCQFEQVYEPT